MKRKLLWAGVTWFVSSVALADCHMKCVARNPFSGNCVSKVKMCDPPKSVDEVIASLDQTIAGAQNPSDALQRIADNLGMDRAVSEMTLGCMVELAGTGAFGTICAAGIVASDGGCFAEPTCMAACLAAGDRFQRALTECE